MQWKFESFYIYGAVEPFTGENFFLEFPSLNADYFQLFLDEFAKKYPDHLHIIQLDNGRFHLAKKLIIPDNIVLLFQPAYSPDINPIERVWEFMKEELSWANFKNLTELLNKVDQIIQSILPTQVASLTSYDFILAALK